MTRSPSPRISRRALLLSSAAAAGVGATLVVASPASAAPNYSVIPRLPGEISRTDTATSRVGRKKYEVIDVVISGDRARLFVPHSAKPGTAVSMIWYYHASGSNYAALSGAYQYSADQAVDQGLVSICPNYGGSLYTNPVALAAQTKAAAWVTSVWTVSASLLRSNSGGGTLLAWAYGKRMVPAIRGAYHASGSFDMEDLSRRDPSRVLPIYGNDPAAVRAANPLRLPESAWAGARLRVTGSSEDELVPLEMHGGRFYRRALPQAKEATIVVHSGEDRPNGHTVPSSTNADMLTTFARWLREGPA
ncbi:hypothetical protein C1I63_07225 [Rathayibacter caricis DSM 15933]|uniref:Alpha/beta hydrolase n=1 Tax=Rathayibacter caricis DSM 15933 TaxID=1328867 RepID=A0A2T4USZ2_9MICO|nr:hypothetical protein [Rathayibacter caricis]PTL72658.1 hypothetical protein C1I63_07225 [Rathayibacter caricis DSM 15933]